MLNFKVDVDLCISCGQCASDCPAMIISMENNLPMISPELESYCISCMHCVAICSEAALSILGYGPEAGREINRELLPAPESVEMLIRARRSVRNFQDENLDTSLVERMVDVAWQAPSGHNDRELLYTLIDDKGVLYDLREEAIAGLEQLIAEGKLPEGMEMFSDIIAAWKEGGNDIIFRGAPHLLIASADDDSASPLHDCLIGLTTFEIYAASCGIGTIWNGLATLTINDLVPSLKRRLNIPDTHQIGYVMGFGKPAIRYRRTVDRGQPKINRVMASQKV